jgi:hypothetical protein
MALGLVGIIWGTKLLDDEAELEKPADVIPFRGERR